MRTRRQTGFTLVEVLSVLVLLGILAAVVIRFFVDLDGEARSKGIEAALSELNGREQQAWAKEMMETRGAATDAAIFAQVDPGNLGEEYAWASGPEADGASRLLFQGFEAAVYRTPSQLESPGIWRRSEGSSFDFGTTGTDGFLQFYERDPEPSEPWVESGDGITANSEWAQILRENPLTAGSDSAYELELVASLGDWTGPYQGYGIFFNTTLQADGSGIEDGYAVQFDPGLGDGKIIVREWRDGSQRFPETYSFADYTEIPRISSDRDWWTSEHNLEVEVQPGSTGQSDLAVYVDGELLFNDFSFDHAEGTTYTGLRSWGDYAEASEFTQLDVRELTPGP